MKNNGCESLHDVVMNDGDDNASFVSFSSESSVQYIRNEENPHARTGDTRSHTQGDEDDDFDHLQSLPLRPEESSVRDNASAQNNEESPIPLSTTSLSSDPLLVNNDDDDDDVDMGSFPLGSLPRGFNGPLNDVQEHVERMSTYVSSHIQGLFPLLPAGEAAQNEGENMEMVHESGGTSPSMGILSTQGSGANPNEEAPESASRQWTRWGLTGASHLQVGVRLAQRASNFSFKFAREASDVVHTSLRTGAQVTSVAAAATGASLGIPGAGIAVAGAVMGAVEVSDTISKVSIATAGRATSVGLMVSDAALSASMMGLTKLAEVHNLSHTELSNHNTALVVLQLVQLIEQRENKIPSDRSIFQLGEALMTYGHLQSSLRCPFPLTNIPAMTLTNNKDRKLIHIMLPRCIRYSCASYGVSYIRFMGFQTPPGAETATDIIVGLLGVQHVASSWTSSLHQPAYGIFIDPELQAVVIVFRGSANASDALTDLCAEPTERGHEGFFRSAEWFSENLKETVINALPEGYRVIITGHSLGAGVTTALVSLWKHEPFFEHGEGFGFATPCVLPFEQAMILQGMTSVVVGPDVVGRLSVGSVDNLTHALVELTAVGQNGKPKYKDLSEKLKAFDEGNLEREILRVKMGEIRMKMVEEVLYPGGRAIMLMRPCDCEGWEPPVSPSQTPDPPAYTFGQARILELHGAILDMGEIVMHADMMSAHMPSSYASAICGRAGLSL